MIYNDITKWYQIPLSCFEILLFNPTTSASQILTIGDAIDANKSTIKSGSTFSFKPILRDNDTGGQTAVGVLAEASITTLQNNYPDMLTALAYMNNTAYVVSSIIFYLHAQDGQSQIKPIKILNWYGDEVSAVAHYGLHVNWSIKDDEITFDYKGVLPLTILSSSAIDAFAQYI